MFVLTKTCLELPERVALFFSNVFSFQKWCLPSMRSSLGIRGVNLTSFGLQTCLECTTRGECNLRHLPIKVPPSKNEYYQARHDATLLDVLGLRYCFIAHHILDIYKR